MNTKNHVVSTASKPVSGSSVVHESAIAQVTGAASYIDDIPEVRGTLHAAPIMSKVAHGKLLNIDASAALALPGVRGMIQAKDIPGDAVLASFAGDEPVFASETMQHIGQVIGVMIASSALLARRAASLVKLDIESLPAVLTVKDALKAKNYVLPPVFVARGDAAAAIALPHTASAASLKWEGKSTFI